uniref:Uncharacterized protein n=1 Tax=Mustela putorius furo TaxID=9669 RepID=M3Y0X7_MUSPF
EERKQAPRRSESPTRDSIPAPRDHDPSRTQRLNPLSHPGAPYIFIPRGTGIWRNKWAYVDHEFSVTEQSDEKKLYKCGHDSVCAG